MGSALRKPGKIEQAQAQTRLTLVTRMGRELAEIKCREVLGRLRADDKSYNLVWREAATLVNGSLPKSNEDFSPELRDQANRLRDLASMRIVLAEKATEVKFENTDKLAERYVTVMRAAMDAKKQKDDRKR